MIPFTILQGDCLSEMSLWLEDNSVDAIVTDPPYGLEFMGKDWDAPWKSDRRQVFDGTLTDVRANPFGRSKVRYGTGASYGAGVQQMHAFEAWATEIFAECLRVLKPGGYLLSFGGSRTYHRMASAVEDAGFEIRDQIMWVYGSGFPKSHNGEWGGTALKPSHEPIVVARKPLVGTVEANWLAFGTGALNIDASRIMTADQERDAAAYRRLSSLGSASCIRGISRAQLRGSLLHIASVLRSCSTGGTDRSRSAADLDGTLLDSVLCERLVARLFPNGVWCGGSSWSAPDSLCGCRSCRHSYDVHIRLLREVAQDGSPSLADALERICLGQFGLEHNRVCQCTDRLSNSDDFPLALSFAFLLNEYCTLYSATPQSARWPANLIHDGSDEPTGLLGDAARFFYCAKTSKSDRGAENNHPTVKPTDLMAYLCRLVTPAGGVVLDPFMGSGSTGKAAMREGFRFIGIEREAEYAAIARARIAAELGKRLGVAA